jgi:hypothetical protein
MYFLGDKDPEDFPISETYRPCDNIIPDPIVEELLGFNQEEKDIIDNFNNKEIEE